jgi:hypothetical protein
MGSSQEVKVSHQKGRRSFVARWLRALWRGLRIVLLSFAALGPPPPPLLPTRDRTEQVLTVRRRGRKPR